ncbi:MAG: hypothetical protein HY814_08950 [Candidatus Riflebacteria bacterium]|nr:hypothetical protein [Candidatus Riflebacteria bacterium]
MESSARLVTLALLLAAALLAVTVSVTGQTGHAGRASESAARKAFVRSTGLCSPCLGRGTDGPKSLIEGLAGSMTEHPAAYSRDRFCELAGRPPLPDRPLYRIDFVRAPE